MKRSIMSSDMYIKIAILCLSLCVFCAQQRAMAQEHSWEEFVNTSMQSKDLSAYFKNIHGAAVLYSPHKQNLQVYNAHLASTQTSPFSTFKIISTLLGLDAGIITDQSSKMQYNGTQYWLDAWNKDVNLQEAFSVSCVWYYHQLIYTLQPSDVAKFLQKMHYGNEDISAWKGNGSNAKAELNGFWLGSSLKISPLEQVRVLANIFENRLAIEKKNILLLQDIMLQKGLQNMPPLYAKTGANGRGISWFVGFLQRAEGRVYFAFFVDDLPENGAKISHAKEVALEVLQDTYGF